MKKYKIAAVCCLISLSANAQIAIDKLDLSGLNISADIGTTFSRIQTSKATSAKGLELGVTWGITGSYTFKNNLVAELGVRMTEKGTKELTNLVPSGVPSYQRLTLQEMNYTEIPITVGYKVQLSKLVSITPKIGGYWARGRDGFGFGENFDSGTGYGIDPFQSAIETYSGRPQLNYYSFSRRDFGLVVGVDINVWQMSLRTTYSHGLANLYSQYDPFPRNRSLSVSLGYTLFKR